MENYETAAISTTPKRDAAQESYKRKFGFYPDDTRAKAARQASKGKTPPARTGAKTSTAESRVIAEKIDQILADRKKRMAELLKPAKRYSRVSDLEIEAMLKRM